MATKIKIEVDEKTLRTLVARYFSEQGIDVKDGDVHIEVKSTQNYRAEWEAAAFRATVEKVIP